MLFLLLAACDPGYQSILTVEVSSDVVETYSPEAPAFVVVGPDSIDHGNTIGAICGGSADLRFTLALNELGCGPGGDEVTVSLFPASSVEPGILDTMACGNWAQPMNLSPEGEPDAEELGVYEEMDDPENEKCGGESRATVRFDASSIAGR